MFGLSWGASPFDADVEKVTDEKQTSEDWAAIMNFCDKVGDSEQNARDSLRSILKRLNHEDPHVQLLAITLLDACVNNCGKYFRLVVASRDFTQDYRKLLSKVQEPKVNEKLKMLLKKWADEDFKKDDQLALIPALYKDLVKEGVVFPQPELNQSKGESREEIEEINDLSKAIELSLLESTSPSKSTGANSNSLYPSTKLHSTSQDCRKVRALYDFEAAEDNELTFKAGEIIFVLDDSDPNWWKGYNQNGEGLFPSNFVSTETAAESEPSKMESSKQKVSFDETVRVVKLRALVEINEAKIDRLLHILHEADPCSETSDSEEILCLEEEVNAMGPLIDAELEKVDRKHAELTKLSQQLVDALNLYHMMMRDPMMPSVSKPVEGLAPPYFNRMPNMPSNAQFLSLSHQHPQQHSQPLHRHSLPHLHTHPHSHPPPHLHPPNAHLQPHFPLMPGSPQGPQSRPPQQYNGPFPPRSLPNYIGGYQPPHFNYALSQHLNQQQPLSPSSGMPAQMTPVSTPYPTPLCQPVSKLKPEFNQQ
nr:PREDICTED: signal transducing adapter molecule 2 [Bemisia tabaci]